MSFSNIIGNEKIKNILIKSISNNTVLHSYMFIGSNGIGKKMIAKQFAKMVLCENSGADSGFEECDNWPCNVGIEFARYSSCSIASIRSDCLAT